MQIQALASGCFSSPFNRKVEPDDCCDHDHGSGVEESAQGAPPDDTVEFRLDSEHPGYVTMSVSCAICGGQGKCTHCYGKGKLPGSGQPCPWGIKKKKVCYCYRCGGSGKQPLLALPLPVLVAILKELEDEERKRARQHLAA